MTKRQLITLHFQLALIAVNINAAKFETCGTDYQSLQRNLSALTGASISEVDRCVAARLDRKRLAKRAAADTALLRVPVVFHVVHRSGIPVGQNENYPDVVIYDILKNINDAYRKRPGTFWAGDGADAHIEFCLATIDTNGQPTSGILRVNGSVIPGYDSNGVCARACTPWGGYDLQQLIFWDQKKYINIYIVHNIPDAGGFTDLKCIVISQPLSREEMNYETYIHELGHYLGLYHTFEDSCSETDCATQGDRICDTPPTRAHNIDFTGSCIGLEACTSGKLSQVRNYMDYGIEACQNLFTAGQVERMRASLDTTATADLRSRLTTAANLKSTGCWGNVPPFAAFVADRSQACIGDAVMFRNYSRLSTSYNWTFENARPAASAAIEPRVIFLKAGDHRATLICTNNSGTSRRDTVFKVEGIANPQVKGTLLPAGNRHTLTAISAYPCRWFDSDTASLPGATGTEFTTPPLSHSVTYYVQASGSGAEQTVGEKENNDIQSGSTDGNVYFTVYKPMYIKSVTVYAKGKRFKFFLRNADAVILRQFTVDGDSIPKGPMDIAIDAQLAPGQYYFDCFTNTDVADFWSCSLGIDVGGASFPYKIDGLISIDSTDRSPENYYFYYNWKVQEILCSSERVPVQAAVLGDNGVISGSDRVYAAFSATITTQNTGALLRVISPVSAKVTIEIFSITGKRVRRFDLPVSRNSVSTYIISKRTLTAGRYIVSIHSGEFKQKTSLTLQ